MMLYKGYKANKGKGPAGWGIIITKDDIENPKVCAAISSNPQRPFRWVRRALSAKEKQHAKEIIEELILWGKENDEHDREDLCRTC